MVKSDCLDIIHTNAIHDGVRFSDRPHPQAIPEVVYIYRFALEEVYRQQPKDAISMTYLHQEYLLP